VGTGGVRGGGRGGRSHERESNGKVRARGPAVNRNSALGCRGGIGRGKREVEEKGERGGRGGGEEEAGEGEK